MNTHLLSSLMMHALHSYSLYGYQLDMVNTLMWLATADLPEMIHSLLSEK